MIVTIVADKITLLGNSVGGFFPHSFTELFCFTNFLTNNIVCDVIPIKDDHPVCLRVYPGLTELQMDRLL